MPGKHPYLSLATAACFGGTLVATVRGGGGEGPTGDFARAASPVPVTRTAKATRPTKKPVAVATRSSFLMPRPAAARKPKAARKSVRPAGAVTRSEPEADLVRVAVAAAEARRVADRWDRHLHALPSRGRFVRSLRVRATAYTPIPTPMEGGRYTYTEKDGRSEHGVAVDPRVIPLGSRLWIPGYGHATADDTGGRIKGHRIDVRVQDRDNMYEWGVRHVRVYVLEEPEDR